jgi:sulfofructose kinase
MAQAKGVPVILDAGSVHAGTLALLDQGDYLICSEKFAFSFTGETDEARALEKLRGHAPNVIITLGARGLVWARGQSAGRAPAYQVQAIDTTCAGDIFHGAFAAGLASGMAWEENLAYASAAAALSCTRIGGRPAIPTAAELHPFIRRFAPGQPD